MHWLRVPLLSGLLGVVAACGPASEPSSSPTDDTRSERASVITSWGVQAFKYTNIGRSGGLPEVLPVVVSYDNDGKATSAFRIDCPSNYGALLNGFGYEALSLNQLEDRGALTNLEADLLNTGAKDVPVVTLSCARTPEAQREQVSKVFRRIDAKPGEPEYYVRFRDEPMRIFSMSCVNFFSALALTDTRGTDLEKLSSPINKQVLDLWKEKGQGITEHQVNCFSPSSNHPTATPLPPAPRTLPVPAAPSAPAVPSNLFRVEYDFGRPSALEWLYLINSGKGYALDCGSNRSAIQAAFGFDLSMPEKLESGDSRFVDSDPDHQPILGCRNTKVTVIRPVGAPNVRYFRFNDDDVLFHFSCLTAADFFQQSAVPSGANAGEQLQEIVVPHDALPHLLVNHRAPGEPVAIHVLGCAGPTQAAFEQLELWFEAVFGRKMTDAERPTVRSRFTTLWMEQKSTAAANTVARLDPLEADTIAMLESLVVEKKETDQVIDRAAALASKHPSLEPGLDGNRLVDMLRAKVAGSFGAALRPNFTSIKAFIEERTPRLAVRIRDHWLSTRGAEPTAAEATTFDRALMENPNSAADYKALQLAGAGMVWKNTTLRTTVLNRAIAEGKRTNGFRPGLDRNVVYSQDRDFFVKDVAEHQSEAYPAGVYTWVRGQVAKSRAGWRKDLIESYDVIFGCPTNTDTENSPCLVAGSLANWTSKFYRPEVNMPIRDNPDFTLAMIEERHEEYLHGCATNPAKECADRFDVVVERACKVNTGKCSTVAAMTTKVVTEIKAKKLFANYRSTECFVRTGRTAGCGTTYLR